MQQCTQAVNKAWQTTQHGLQHMIKSCGIKTCAYNHLVTHVDVQQLAAELAMLELVSSFS